MKRRLLVSTALCAVFAQSAFAADLPTMKGPPPAPVAAPFSWTGFYLGGNIGVIFDPDSVTNESSNYFGSLLPPGATNKLSPNGLLGGVTAGYNLQTSNLVFGLEGDFDLTSARASFSDNRCGGLCWTHSAKLSSFADARVRLGYAFDRFLPFVTGGVVYGNISNTFYDSPGDINSSAGPFTLGRGASFGWTVGGGGEYALDSHWSIKAQYLYMQFPDVTRVAPGGYAFKFKDSAQVAEVGVNYRF